MVSLWRRHVFSQTCRCHPPTWCRNASHMDFNFPEKKGTGCLEEKGLPRTMVQRKLGSSLGGTHFLLQSFSEIEFSEGVDHAYN